MKAKTIANAIAIGLFGIFSATGVQASGTEEVLLGIDFSQKTVDIHVASGGCTKKEDFHFDVNKGVTGKPPYIVTIRRITPDNCKALIHEGVRLSFDKTELGLDGLVEFTLTNKLGNTSQHR